MPFLYWRVLHVKFSSASFRVSLKRKLLRNVHRSKFLIGCCALKVISKDQSRNICSKMSANGLHVNGT
jgi:hypothetical protein